MNFNFFSIKLKPTLWNKKFGKNLINLMHYINGINISC